MKPPTNINPQNASTSILHQQIFEQAPAGANSLSSTAWIQCFRVPWAPLRGSEHSDSSRLEHKPAPANTSGSALHFSKSTSHIEAKLDSLSEGATGRFELVLEEIRERTQAKTAVLREALQYSERSQLRFWGINE